ncbi:hypothetical protein KC354_g6495 [Hortaea werneckii]|nr:hypothetical protein KC354_g6495 [Hortaea werneckii]
MAQNPNGLGANANAAMYNGVNGSIMPSAGHYSDMQTLMQNMETLSGWLQQNREEWSQLQEGLSRVERMGVQNGGSLPGAREGEQLNGDAEAHDPDQPPTTTQLSTALSAAQARIAHLESTLNTHSTLQTLYEETLSDATDRIRQYAFEQQQHTIALHKHYTTLLSQSRNETIEAQLTHQAWQGHMERLSEGVREAMRARAEEKRPWLGRIQGLKEENRVLRKMVGWEPPAEDSEDEEEGEQGAGQRGSVGSGQQALNGMGRGQSQGRGQGQGRGQSQGRGQGQGQYHGQGRGGADGGRDGQGGGQQYQPFVPVTATPLNTNIAAATNNINQYAAQVGQITDIANQGQKLLNTKYQHGMRTGFADAPEDRKTKIATNYLQLTPPRYIYVYDLLMIRDAQNMHLVHRAADRKALLPILVPHVPELNNNHDWVSDGDLLWSTSDLFDSFTPNAALPPRGSLMVMRQHDLTQAVDLRYHNECGVLLTIDRVEIHFLERIDTRQHMRHLMDVPAGMPLRRSTPAFLLRGLNAMLSLNARNNAANLTPKGGNKFFDHGIVQTLHDQARSLRGFFLSARPGLDRLLLNISPAYSPFWDVITVHDFINANHASDARLLALLKGLKVRIRYAPRIPFNRPSESLRFINDLVGDIANAMCQDPAIANPSFTVQAWYGNAQDVAQQQRNHPLYPANNAESRAMVQQISNRPQERAVKVARNAQSNPAEFEYFPASMLEIVEFQPRHGDLTKRQVSEMIRQAQSEPANHANSIINHGLPMFGLLGQGQNGLRNFGNMSTGTQLISVPGVFLNAPEVKYGLPANAGGQKPPTALVRGAAWRLVDGGGRPYLFKKREVLQTLSAVATTGAQFPTQSLDVIRRALQNHGILDRGLHAPQWNDCSTANGVVPQINGSTSTRHNANANTPAQETDIYNVLSRVPAGSPCAVIIPEKEYDLYAYLKRVADLRVGLHTVVMDKTKLKGPEDERFPQVASNIALKFNLKSKGTNHKLGDTSFPGLRPQHGQRCDVIVIGADVTHPGVGSREGTPSIAAVVGSTDDEFMHFPGSMRLQRSRKEEIVELGDMVKERLIDWAMKHRGPNRRPTLPARMLFYRDGVSESQYAKIRSFEIPQIQKAFNWAQAYLEWSQGPHLAGVSLDPASNPWPAMMPPPQPPTDDDEVHFVDNTRFNASPVPFQLTYVVVGKRHNTRFYPTKEEDITKIITGSGPRIANRNVKPGLVVDQVITHPYSFDFYLQSHQAVKGTARSAHYFVLQNDMGLTHDQLQQTTHDFCYAYARATKGVSYCAPAYYADRLCDRGRCYLRHWLKCRQGTAYEYTRPRNVATGETPKAYNTIVKDYLRDQPYWRPYALAPQGQPGPQHRPQKYGFDRRNPWHENLDDVMFYL